MELIYRKIEDLKKLENNPRTITEEQLSKLKGSIERNPDYFEARPLILSNRTGELVIIAGNQRYDACVQLGMKEVPTVLIEGLTEEREHEIIIRDNVNNGEWDVVGLTNWDIESLKEWGANLPEEWSVNPNDFNDGFTLPVGDKSNSVKMTFTLSEEQAEIIKVALDLMKDKGADYETFGNDNSNGNAIYNIVKEWEEQRK